MRRIWFLIALAGVALGAIMLMARSGPGEWTTDSSRALAELAKGHDAEMKIYRDEAVKHYRRALELDPDFVAAKLALMRVIHDRDELARLAEELAVADPRPLTAREQFLVRYRLARHEGRSKEARQILKSFLDVYPGDPWGLDAWADLYWSEQNLEKASAVYEKLLAADPNWVLAQNRLGYMAMAQGRFAEAEELFRTYAYIAPDQANPYDSMGELLTVLGRYDEARAQLEEALAIKPDFCASYEHLIEVETLAGRLEAVEPVIERAEAAGCRESWIALARCDLAFWRDYMAGDYDGPWREERSECLEKVGRHHFLIHRMAALSGRFEVAREIEDELAKRIEKGVSEDTAEIKHYKGALLHFQGVRLLAQGETEAAAERLQKADELLLYWGQGESILKLFNRLNLACAYDLAGRRLEAKKLLGEVAEVNPPMAGFYGYLLEAFST